MVLVNEKSTEVFEWPTPAAINRMIANGELHHLTGFENNKQYGSGYHLNWILSNGNRSQQRDELARFDYTHMMPEGSHDKIRSVSLHYED